MADWKFIFKLLFAIIALWAGSVESQEKPRHIPQSIWDKVLPYLMPDDHPAKQQLDKLFGSMRVTFSEESLKKAGFSGTKPRIWTHLVVSTHKEFPDYVFKIFLDVQRLYKEIPEYMNWIKRIEGRNLIEDLIREKGWESEFKVPKKWIYVLPENPSPSKDFIRKNFILVAEKMDILERKSNNRMWKNDLVNETFLTKFYFIIETLGLADMAKPDNAPFCQDGRVALLDTESYNKWPVLHKKLRPHLTPEMRKYWKGLSK